MLGINLVEFGLDEAMFSQRINTGKIGMVLWENSDYLNRLQRSTDTHTLRTTCFEPTVYIRAKMQLLLF